MCLCFFPSYSLSGVFVFDQILVCVFFKGQEWAGESSRLLLFEQATRTNFKFINTRLLRQGRSGRGIIVWPV